MTSIADGSVKIQTTKESNPAPPSWFGEIVLLSGYLRTHGVLSKISEQVRFARRRFGRYEVIDFLAVLFGYAISGERTLQDFYEQLQPFAIPFMALFDRDQLPARSTLSRFLAALTEAPVEGLRTLFLDDLLSRPISNEKQTGGLLDRTNNMWVVFDIDGTREAARQRALPKTEDLPAPFRRLDDVCAPGYTGRKRGQVVRTRTVISQAHSYHWLGSFGNRGNGRYREELRKGLAAIGRYLTAYQLEPSRTLLRLDGQYGTGAVLADLAPFAFVTRGKEYSVLDHPLVQARLHLPPDQFQQRPESQGERSLYDCPNVSVGSLGILCRVIVATHPATKKKSPVGVTRAGVVYELFFTNLPSHAFTASDVVELYLHRGAFEPVLSDPRPGDRSRQVVQPFGLGTGVLATGSAMDVEPEARTGASVGASAAAHHRVCSCHPTAGRAGCHSSSLIRACIWIRSTYYGRFLENGTLHGSRLSSPARWDAALSSRPVTFCTGATSRSRREPTHSVCGQHSQLPPLPSSRAVSMEWHCHGKAAPGECAAASA